MKIELSACFDDVSGRAFKFENGYASFSLLSVYGPVKFVIPETMFQVIVAYGVGVDMPSLAVTFEVK